MASQAPVRGVLRAALVLVIVVAAVGCASSAAGPVPTAAPPTRVPVLPGTEDQIWFVVQQPTPAYSINGDQLWVASPGAWYRVSERRPGWLLAVAEGDPNFWSVWIAHDGRIQLSNGRLVESTR